MKNPKSNFQRIRNRGLRLVLLALLSLASLPQAQAQDAAPTPFQQCAAAAQVQLKPNGHLVNKADWKTLKPCLEKARETCAASNNITLPAQGSGQKLAWEHRKTLRTCEGLPRHHHHHHKSDAAA